MASRISSSLRSIGSQIDNIVGHVGEREHLSIATQENNGALRILKPGGGYFDHVRETLDAMNGLSNSIERLNMILSDPNLSTDMRRLATNLLSKASKSLDAMEQALKQ